VSGQGAAISLPRGDILLFGGDTAYPVFKMVDFLRDKELSGIQFVTLSATAFLSMDHARQAFRAWINRSLVFRCGRRLRQPNACGLHAAARHDDCTSAGSAPRVPTDETKGDYMGINSSDRATDGHALRGDALDAVNGGGESCGGYDFLNRGNPRVFGVFQGPGGIVTVGDCRADGSFEPWGFGGERTFEGQPVVNLAQSAESWPEPDGTFAPVPPTQFVPSSDE
jgi:hypothetical protein